jgi:hypothetical protein
MGKSGNEATIGGAGERVFSGRLKESFYPLAING